ncbi:hypothetical protein ASPCAL03748 [Aspergillus calidoustus]|uniref:Uncharacterized protein n=1 Tax=Aspergillus calidoustus TaxID=454130 RepID=A0A0U4YZ40_ASPCI|nr:hypothetical protein ASPCAL03748 [Aspergillus calidoustus]
MWSALLLTLLLAGTSHGEAVFAHSLVEDNQVTTTINDSSYTDTATIPILPRAECTPPANSDPNVPAPNCNGAPARYHLFVFSHDRGSGAFSSEWRGRNCHGTGTCRARGVTPDWRQKTTVEGHVTNPAFPDSLQGIEVFGDTCAYTADINVTKGTRSVGTLSCKHWKDAICIKGPDTVAACGEGKYAAYMLICEWPDDYYLHMGDEIAPFP